MKCPEAEDRLRKAVSKDAPLASLIVTALGLNVPVMTSANLAICYRAIGGGQQDWKWKTYKSYVHSFLHHHFVSRKDRDGFFRQQQFDDITQWPVAETPFAQYRRFGHGVHRDLPGEIDDAACLSIAERFFRQDGNTSSIQTRLIHTGRVSVYHFDDLETDGPSSVLDALEIVGISEADETRARENWSSRSACFGHSVTIDKLRPKTRAESRQSVTACVAACAMYTAYVRRNGVGVTFRPVKRAPDNVTFGNHDLRWEAQFLQDGFLPFALPPGYEPPGGSKTTVPGKDRPLRVIAVSWADLIDLTRNDFPSKDWLVKALHGEAKSLWELYFSREILGDIDAIEIW